MTRLPRFTRDSATLARFAGSYASGVTIILKEGSLTLAFPSGLSSRLVPVSPSRCMANLGGAFLMEFVEREGKVVAMLVPDAGFTAERLPDK